MIKLQPLRIKEIMVLRERHEEKEPRVQGKDRAISLSIKAYGVGPRPNPVLICDAPLIGEKHLCTRAGMVAFGYGVKTGLGTIKKNEKGGNTAP